MIFKTLNCLHLFKLLAMFCYIAPLSLLRDLVSNIPLIFIPLIIRMPFSLFHDMADKKKRGAEN